jgi:hypothetical protein
LIEGGFISKPTMLTVKSQSSCHSKSSLQFSENGF